MTSAQLYTVGASTYYVNFEGLEDLPIKSIAQVVYEAKVAGNTKAIASGRNGITLRQTTSVGYETNPTMAIEVHLSGDPNSASYKFYEWFRACLPPSDGGEGAWESNRRSGSITVYDPSGDPRLVWELENAWPIKYSMTEADVTGDQLAVETFEIAAEAIRKIQGFGAAVETARSV